MGSAPDRRKARSFPVARSGATLSYAGTIWHEHDRVGWGVRKVTNTSEHAQLSREVAGAASRFDLVPHPAERQPPLAITVTAHREGDLLLLDYLIGGDVDHLIYPPATGGARRDELWRSTCLEAFVRVSGRRDYLELNFAPSLDWNAYALVDYRAGLREADLAPALERDGYRLSACVRLPDDAGVEWQLGLSAVIEEIDGAKSYWALAHAPGPPDFHNPACFAAMLPPPERP